MQNMEPAESIDVQHIPDQRRFVLPMGDTMAILDYELHAGQIDFTRTWVPPEFRGGNHARILVRQGLDWARNQGLEIRASCWYVAKVLGSNDRT